MRIISQDGKFDIPYDEIVVEIFDKCVVGRLKEYIGRDIILGSYSTEVKTEKAMEMLHKEYGKHFFDQGGAMATANFYVSPFAFIPPKVFQFPKDEDVEVENET